MCWELELLGLGCESWTNDVLHENVPRDTILVMVD